jgi:hypothetical protein
MVQLSGDEMYENIFPKHSVRTMVILFLLFIAPISVLSAEQNKKPEWVLDTIILPVQNNTRASMMLFEDKRGRIVYHYFTPKTLFNRKVFDISTHKEIDPNSLELFTKPKTDNFLDGLKIVKYHFERFAIPHTIYETKAEILSSSCNPIGPSLSFFTQTKTESYIFLLSFENKIEFESDSLCEYMNGKQKIKIHNLGIDPLIWVIDDNRLLLGDNEKPFFIVIDLKKIDLVFNKEKALLFDYNGVKGYWVKASIINECVEKAKQELSNKGYDIYSGKPLKGNVSFNEFVDQEITKELNKPD